MILKDHIQNETRPNNKEKMVKSIERASEAISIETLKILIANMPNQLKAIINVGGSSTRW